VNNNTNQVAGSVDIAMVYTIIQHTFNSLADAFGGTPNVKGKVFGQAIYARFLSSRKAGCVTDAIIMEEVEMFYKALLNNQNIDIDSIRDGYFKDHPLPRIGDVVSVDFGISKNAKAYYKYIECTIAAIHDEESPFRTHYIVSANNIDLVGLAVYPYCAVLDGPVYGLLKCTRSLSYGVDSPRKILCGLETKEKALEYFGVKA